MEGLTLNIDLDTVDIDKLEKIISRRKVNTKYTKLCDTPFVQEYEKDYFYWNNIKCCYLSFVGLNEYYITITGDVYREYKKSPARIIKPLIFNNKYYVNLCQNSVVRRYALHKLLATAFIENPLGYRFVRFKDGDFKNYSISNLEWRKKSCDAPLSGVRTPIDMYDKEGNFIKTFDSINDATEETGIGRCNIGAVLSGRTKTAGGYVWKYSK